MAERGAVNEKLVDHKLYLEFLATMPIACVDVVIVHASAVLLVRRATPPAEGEWWLPGGRVLKGETLKQAARRKAAEEVGLDCWVGPIVHTAETIFPDGPDGVPVHSINSAFLLIPKHGPDVRLDPTLSDFRWYSFEKGEDLHPYVAACLAGAGFDGKVRSGGDDLEKSTN